MVRASAQVVDDRRILNENKNDKDKVLRVGVVCGGPSAERGISLNSARSVLDHIQVPTYLFHLISSFLLINQPS